MLKRKRRLFFWGGGGGGGLFTLAKIIKYQFSIKSRM